ncbi:MAG: choice-of-anchor Q domain-containing protein [Anaerolineaceae bacterium]
MKTTKVLSICLIAFLGLLLIVNSASSSEIQSTIFYVKPGEDGTCATWDDACDLQTALSLADAEDQIWAAAGIYLPTTDSNRDATFFLESGVSVYGGFPAAGGTWDERDWNTNITILSGDIGTEGVNTDNTRHVVTGSGADETAVLDGFTISGGYTMDGGYPQNAGAGVCNDAGSPSLANIILSANTSINGGGMYNSNSSPTLMDISFSGNSASAEGGGILNVSNSTPTLTRVIFTGNSARSGAGMQNLDSNPILMYVTFYGNLAAGDLYGYGGGMNNYNSSPILTNVTFEENTSQYAGGGMYNTLSSPTLEHVTFIENSAEYGGGIFNSSGSPILTDVNFSGNSATYDGGGMDNNYDSSPILSNVIFFDNSADVGGGMYSIDYSNPSLMNVNFTENSANFGGGMYTSGNCNISLINVTFMGNTATTRGGGMETSYYGSAGLTNVTFSGNIASEGGGMYTTFINPILINVTFFGNVSTLSLGGGMINYQSSPTITNTVLWGNSPDQIYNSVGGSVNINFSDIQGDEDWGGIGNINLDPHLQVLADTGGFTRTHALAPGSPAIDSGSPSICPPFDQRGFSRPMDGDVDGTKTCDMGAYEFGIFLYLPNVVK